MAPLYDAVTDAELEKMIQGVIDTCRSRVEALE